MTGTSSYGEIIARHAVTPSSLLRTLMRMWTGRMKRLQYPGIIARMTDDGLLLFGRAVDEGRRRGGGGGQGRKRALL
jgi:hypothetical protein